MTHHEPLKIIKPMKTLKKTIHTLFAVIGLMLVLGACDSSTADNSDNVTFIVITDTPASVMVVEQAATPVESTAPPAASPIPNTTPDVALQIADRYLRNGYYENAVFSYQALLNREDAGAEIRAAAAFGMGQAALREGLFQNAVDALTLLIEQFPGDFRAAQAYFLRGDAYLGLSQWQLAINDFQQYLILRAGLIDSYVYERIGDAQLALDQFDTALNSYTLATQADRTDAPQIAFRQKVARLYALAGNTDQAIQQYDAIIALLEGQPVRAAALEFDAGQSLFDAGSLDAGLARMRRIFLQYETRPEAYQAMSILVENGVQLDAYRRGRVAFFNGYYEEAVEAFNQYTTQVTLDQIPAELQLLLGQSYRAAGNSPAALIAFQTILDQYPTDPLFGTALLETGRTRFLNGEIDAAILRYLEVADNYGYLTDAAPEALWRAGYLYGTNGNPAEARVIFERLADTYPTSEWASSGLLIAASAALNSGDAAGAENLYARLAASSTGEDQAEAYLQVGRLALARGDLPSGQAALQQATLAAPDTYYAARAEDLLSGRAPFTPPARIVFEFDDIAEVTEAENWIRSTFGINQEGPLWPLSPELESNAHLRRGRELWAVGAFDEAEIEFADVLNQYAADGLSSYQLSIFFRIIGVYYPSQQGAANLINAAGFATLQAPAYIAKLRYPAYYRDVILNVTQERNIDPLLMLSLIRLESLFDTYATAAAGEKGLTQVIPGTGEYIAGELNWPNYQHSDLFRPYAGIEFGAFYLSEQLNRFDGYVYAALAGYNAGPGRALDWLALAGNDPDAFMATITIDSVQHYIQVTYRNYNIYRALYGADA